MSCCCTPDFAVAFRQESSVRLLTCGSQAIDEVGFASAAIDRDGENLVRELPDPYTNS